MAGGVSAGPGGDERIIGGNVADPADWPYAVALTTPEGAQFCGGSVISPDAVLTAAHCMYAFGKKVDPNSLEVITGRPDLEDTGEGQVLAVDKLFVHPKYKTLARHDVAVLRLDDPTTATPAVLPTPAENRKATGNGDKLRVAGWGSTKRGGGAPSTVLRDVATFAVENRKCAREFPWFQRGEEICTEGRKMPGRHRRTSSCYGDSGGPLVADLNAGARLVGVVSYGGRRCGVKQPTVYSRVSNNLSFIKDKANLP
jgi:secreted trypsin-like serine protease